MQHDTDYLFRMPESGRWYGRSYYQDGILVLTENGTEIELFRMRWKVENGVLMETTPLNSANWTESPSQAQAAYEEWRDRVRAEVLNLILADQ